MSPRTTSNSHVGPSAAVRSDEHAHDRLNWVLMTSVVFVVAALCSSRVFAQAGEKYDTIAMHQALTEPVIKQVESAAKSYASNGSGNPRMVTAYYTLYVPAMLTAPDSVKEMPKIVSDVSGYIARAARSNRAEISQKITVDAFNGLKRVAEGNYLPAGRISAILLMSRLDQKQAESATKTPPVPYLAALPVFMSIYSNEKNPDGVRAAALQGIHRQVTLGFPAIPPDVRGKIAGEMTTLLDGEPPMFRTDDVHAFLQRYAVDILSTFRAANDATLGTKLISISTAEKSSDMIAMHSVARIGEIGPSMKGAAVNHEKVLASWARRIRESFKDEVERLEALERLPQATKQPRKPGDLVNKAVKTTIRPGMRGMGGGDYGMEDMDMGMESYGGPEMGMDMEMGYDDMDMMGMDMMGMGMGMGTMLPKAKPQPPEVLASRRKLNFMLQQLHQGVTGQGVAGLPTRNVGGLLSSADANQKAVIEAWVTSMQEVVDGLNDEMLDDRTKYIEGLEVQAEALRLIAGDPVDEEAIFGADDKVAGAAPGAAPGAAQPMGDADAAPAAVPGAAAPAAAAEAKPAGEEEFEF
ncbi:hypothetical protein Poly51_57000 [Rubripirellula tenax]|uniref:Uncharacterized protein n=1 Tax=Rubripirellula tenax TaxID=2528015 RepID=A0A5C6ECW9_9BACT|nr:hypothetical protein [Rubripirellula tenax]TWU46304.1 hypothetical protein Poly51_57000 [Rubripirellula tenax]